MNVKSGLVKALSAGRSATRKVAGAAKSAYNKWKNTSLPKSGYPSAAESMLTPEGPITLAADGNFLNAVNHALTTSHATGNWRVYSTDPRLDTRGTPVLAGYGFKQYNTAYGGAINGAATGNGLIYKVNPTVSAALSGTASRQYDGTVNASITNLSISGGVGIDGDIATASLKAVISGVNRAIRV